MSRVSSRRARNVFLLGALLVCGAPVVAHAEPSSQDKAESHALFEKALAAYKDGHFDRALPLFQSSQQLDAGVGTLMYTAECHRQLGQTASAWGSFKEAATVAVKLGDKREKIALEKAAEIEKTLSYLSIDLPLAARTDGLQIKRDGRALPASLLGLATPVDPGEHSLEATAPGHRTRTAKVTVGAGGARVVFVFEPLELDGAPADKRDKGDETRPPPSGAALAPSAPAPSGGPWRTVGFAAAGVGVAAGVIGTIVAVRAVDKAGSTNDLAAYEDQRTPYNAGLVVAGLGGALVVTGVALVLTHPSPSTAARLRVSPTVGAGTGGLALAGVF